MERKQIYMIKKLFLFLFFLVPCYLLAQQVGQASYYAHQFHGRKTANGERFNMHDLTAAHRTLPFGTLLVVKNLSNDKAIVVRVNDRGPFVKKRILDLSLGAAKALGFVNKGVAKVEISPLILKKEFLQPIVPERVQLMVSPNVLVDNNDLFLVKYCSNFSNKHNLALLKEEQSL